MKTLVILFALALPASALADSPIPPVGQPTTPAVLAPASDLHVGQMFRLPNRSETFVVEPDGAVRVARLDEVAAPGIGDRAVTHTGVFATIVMLLVIAATWGMRNVALFQSWFSGHSVSRFVPLMLGAVAAIGGAWLTGASVTEAVVVAMLGGLSAIGGHQVGSGVQKTVQQKVEAKAAVMVAASTLSPPAK